MTSQLRIGLIALAILPAAGAACSARPAGEPPPAPVTVTTPSAAASTAPTAVGKERADEVETCGTRSEASFPAAFEDPANLVAGPFVLVGAGLPTPASVVESLGGQKHQVLVRAGHEVTLRVGRRAREHISLGYGSLPQGDVGYDDGHPAVTFVACRPEEDSGSSVARARPSPSGRDSSSPASHPAHRSTSTWWASRSPTASTSRSVRPAELRRGSTTQPPSSRPTTCPARTH